MEENSTQNVQVVPAVNANEVSLESFYKASESEIGQKINNIEYKTQVIKIIKQKCQKEDFEYYRKVAFAGKTETEIDQIMLYIKDQQVYCVKNIAKFNNIWLSKPEKESSIADKWLAKAMNKTYEKTIVDRKIINEIDKVGKLPKNVAPVNSKDLSLYVYGAKYVKNDEGVAWVNYEINKSKTEIESSINFGQYFLGSLLLLTIYAIFIRKREQKVDYQGQNEQELADYEKNESESQEKDE